MVTLQFHLDTTNRDDVHWWVDSPQVPTLRVESSRLRDCQRMALSALAADEIDSTDVRSVLVA
jgi:hypothetical protein